MGRQDASESDFVDGTIEKKGYRRRWLRRAKLNPLHPINHGIHMDTHHLISAEGVKNSKLDELLVEKGYDINDISNLVGFPATLPGACQLKTQLHRGDHKFSTPYMRPGEKSYHKFVSGKLKEKKLVIKKCYGRTKKREKDTEIHKLLDPISQDLLDDINDFDVPLTIIFRRFSARGIGCANCHDIVKASASSTACESRRNHFKNAERDGRDLRYQDPSGSVKGNEKIITYNGSWTPKVGQ